MEKGKKKNGSLVEEQSDNLPLEAKPH